MQDKGEKATEFFERKRLEGVDYAKGAKIYYELTKQHVYKVRYKEAGDKTWKWLEKETANPPFKTRTFRIKARAEKARQELVDSCFEAEVVEA